MTLPPDLEALLDDVEVPDDFLDPARVPSIDPAALDGPLQPGDRLGEFLVLHAIGSGGMGVVYAAQQDRPRRTVAIKVLQRGLAHRDVMKRFELEAEVLAHVQHPGIAQVYAFHPGDRTTPAHLVLELIGGPPITEYADAHQLPFMARVALVAKVCDAIQHAHDRGVIHRDLKPANVLVDEHGQAKILDFGIARATRLERQLSTIRTAHGQLMGTLAYMSPEQLGATPDEIDSRSDVYAIGVLLYRLLSGRLPFDVADAPFAEALRRVLDAEQVPLGLTDADLRGPLERIVHRAMARDRAARYQSAGALAADLRAYCEGRPLQFDEPLRRPRRSLAPHHRILIASIVAAFVAGALAAYVALALLR